MSLIVSCYDEYDFLCDEYQDLFAQSSTSVFQHPYWLNRLYNDLAPQMGVSPIIIALRDEEDGKLQMLLPLVKSRYMGLKCVEPADFGTCDYNCLIARTDLEISESDLFVLRAEIEKHLQPFHLVFFRKMLAGNEQSLDIFGDVKWSKMETCAYDAPVFSPYEDWKKKVISKKSRQAFRRNLRHLEEMGEVIYKVLTEEEEIRNAMSVMREQRRIRYADDLFLQDVYFDFYSSIAVDGPKTGLAQTSIMTVGEDVAGVEFGLRHDNCFHFILSGIDTDKFGKYSPGLVMKDQLLQRRVEEEGDMRIDFTIGDEPYKQKFGGTAMELRFATISNSVLGDMAHQLYAQGGPIKNAAKKMILCGNATKKKAA